MCCVEDIKAWWPGYFKCSERHCKSIVNFAVSKIHLQITLLLYVIRTNLAELRSEMQSNIMLPKLFCLGNIRLIFYTLFSFVRGIICYKGFWSYHIITFNKFIGVILAWDFSDDFYFQFEEFEIWLVQLLDSLWF